MTASSTSAERVAREDMVTFINACFACSGQREFYEEASQQTVSVAFLHEYILGNYRRLYARSLAAGINHFNQAQIILNLLATGAATPMADRAEESALITAALRALPPQRAYALFQQLRHRRINNRRSRALVRRYLAERPDLPFDTIKYRKKLRAAAAHTHAQLPGECGAFLFLGRRQRAFTTPLFEAFRRAQFSQAAVFELPYTIAEGFAARHGIPRDQFLSGIEARMTATEKLRLQRSAEAEGHPPALDWSRVGLTRLALYYVGLPLTERQARRNSIEAAFRDSARRVLGRAPRRFGRVAAVLDRSYSSSGSSEKRRRPLAIALAVSRLLRAASDTYQPFWTPSLADELLVTAHGQTDLATPLLDALEWGPDLIVIVSDGYENAPAHATQAVVRVFRERLDPQHRVSIVHLNPVFDSDNYAPRTLGPAIPTVGLRDAEDLLTMLGFARFADGSAPLEVLESYLAERVERLLHPTRPVSAPPAAPDAPAPERHLDPTRDAPPAPDSELVPR